VTSTFDVLPAIDLRAGRVVRLEKGDFRRETTFSEDPAMTAMEFVEGGAKWLHVVDLDGAREGLRVQLEAVDAVIAAVGERARVEVAGGIRTIAAVADALERGSARVVLGTAALEDPRLVRHVVAIHGPERIAVAVDVREGLARGGAWQATEGGVPADELIVGLADVGAETFEVTAIERDGLLGGPDLRFLERLVRLGRGRIIASGGIRSPFDLRAVHAIGCTGAIVGRALYEGTMTVGAAVRAIAEG
jgi:phosphoribosylformimino-5-aminoimidazole carboxamide ribotide isomerase